MHDLIENIVLIIKMLSTFVDDIYKKYKNKNKNKIEIDLTT